MLSPEALVNSPTIIVSSYSGRCLGNSLLEALFSAQLQVAEPFLSEITWNEINKHLLQKTSGLEHSPRSLLVRPSLDGLCDEGYP